MKQHTKSIHGFWETKGVPNILKVTDLRNVTHVIEVLKEAIILLLSLYEPEENCYKPSNSGNAKAPGPGVSRVRVPKTHNSLNSCRY